jgi:hypothetical protein
MAGRRRDTISSRFLSIHGLWRGWVGIMAVASCSTMAFQAFSSALVSPTETIVPAASR